MVELLMTPRSPRRTSLRGFTLVEVLVSITILAVGLLALGSLLTRSARTAEAASAVSYQTAIMAAEATRLDAVPFAQLAAGTVCDTSAAYPLPRIRCSIVTDINPKLKQVRVRVTPTDNPLLPADSVMFERSMSGPVTPPLSTP